MDLEVRVSQETDRPVVTAIGELDAYSAPILQASLDQIPHQPATAVVVDLSGVSFIDSTGLGVLVTTLKRLRDGGGSLDVVAGEPRVLKVFALTGLDVVIPIHATLADALPPA